jgi:predicted metal-dependent phosphotriesterase family hydrolase
MPRVPTTAGEIDVADLGPVLMHEHVFIRTEALQQGWPGFGGWDRCGLQVTVPLADQLDTLAKLCERGYADRVMLSHDKASFTDGQIEQMLVRNPRDFFGRNDGPPHAAGQPATAPETG